MHYIIVTPCFSWINHFNINFCHEKRPLACAVPWSIASPQKVQILKTFKFSTVVNLLCIQPPLCINTYKSTLSTNKNNRCTIPSWEKIAVTQEHTFKAFLKWVGGSFVRRVGWIFPILDPFYKTDWLVWANGALIRLYYNLKTYRWALTEP